MEITTIEIVLGIALILAIGILIFFILKVQKIQKSYNQLITGVKAGNLEDLLKQHLQKIDAHEKLISGIQSKIEKVINDSRNHLQRVGFKRYNPFHETGGDQSFVLVLLDENNSGAIISSLHQRELTRVYAKKIKQGEAEHKLSDEEQEVLNSTLKKNDRG